MSGEPDFRLTNAGPSTAAARALGLEAFYQLCVYVRDLPYGRTLNAADVLRVLSERRGTCSSKHRLLAAVAHECGRSDIKLMVGIYQISDGLVTLAADLQ